MQKDIVICPGCSLQLYYSNDAIDKEFHASVACRELMFELSYYTLSLHDAYFIHQLAVDAYAAQHFGQGVRPISITFALVGLYLVNELNYTGKEVQQAHVVLAKKTKTWPHFYAPKEKSWLTVQDVTQSSGDNKQEMIKKWNFSVWNIWGSEKKTVAELVNRFM